MEEAYRIVVTEDADRKKWEAVSRQLREFNIMHSGDDTCQSLCLVLYGPDQEMAGGLIGETYWNWLHIELLWLEEGLRGRGYGQRLVIMAEDEARRRGMKHAYLNTFSFQAPDFYERLGYQRFGTLEDFPPGHKRHYYRKDL